MVCCGNYSLWWGDADCAPQVLFVESIGIFNAATLRLVGAGGKDTKSKTNMSLINVVSALRGRHVRDATSQNSKENHTFLNQITIFKAFQMTGR